MNYNLSFLYYYNTFWNKEWGGTLRFYDASQQGLDGRDEHIVNHQIAESILNQIDYLMFDGRILLLQMHLDERSRYADRKSIVLRGDEVELVNKEEFYNAYDRFYNI